MQIHRFKGCGKKSDYTDSRQNTPYSPTAFTGKIIDAHAHIGDWCGDYYDKSALNKFIDYPLSNGDTIEKVIVSNLSPIGESGICDEISGNLETLEAAKLNKKIAPIATCNPKNGNVGKIKRLFSEHDGKFYGLKFHPDGMKLRADDSLYEPYLKFAERKKLPCLFHCGINWENGSLVEEQFRYSDPGAIYKSAKKVPNTPVILAHLGAGGPDVHKIAMDTLIDSIENNDAKLYADISWVDCSTSEKPDIVEIIKRLKTTSYGDKTDRLLFGTDVPIGEFKNGGTIDGVRYSGKEFYDKTVVDVKQAIMENFDDGEEIADKIFCKNAQNLFFGNEKPFDSAVKNLKKYALPAALICMGTLTLAAAGLYMHGKNKNLKTNIRAQAPLS